jgi:hypothetical protein
MAKQWYNIEIECIKYKEGLSCKVGYKEVIAKVKSKGNAYNVASSLENIYNKEYFTITIK